MNAKRKKTESAAALMEELMQLTKNALYRCAQILGIPRRSLMTKSELVAALSEKEDKTGEIMENIKKSKTGKSGTALKSIPSAVSVSERTLSPKSEPTPLPVGQIKPVKETQVLKPAATSTTTPPVPKVELREPESVWVGEEGPDLPSEYGVTVLRALPRDPFWAYLYWEISRETRDAICAEEGEWYFDMAESLIRVLNDRGELVKEIPVLLDANCWYLNLAPNGSYHFELGLKNQQGVFRTIARSNRLTLPPMEPSNVTDEHWAVVSDEFQEILYHSAGLELAAGGGSPSMIPHVLRHRLRIPWNWTTEQGPSSHQWPSSQAWPSSHVLPSSRTLAKK